MITHYNTVKLAGITYSLVYDTNKQEYHVKEEGMYVDTVHVKKEFAEAKGLFNRLTNKV